MLFLALKKVQMVKITPYQILTTQKSTPQNLLLVQMGSTPLSCNAISKTLNYPFTPKEEFLENLANINITFVYLLFPIMLRCFSKKSLEHIMRYKLQNFGGKLNSNFPHATKKDIFWETTVYQDLSGVARMPHH